MAVMTPHAGDPLFPGGALPLLVAVIAASVVAVCAAVALFVFRTPLRVWLHSRYGLRVLEGAAHRKDYGGGGGGDRLYDALVSCSVKDQGRRDTIRFPCVRQGNDQVSKGERGRKGRECKFQNKAHRTF